MSLKKDMKRIEADNILYYFVESDPIDITSFTWDDVNDMMLWLDFAKNELNNALNFGNKLETAECKAEIQRLKVRIRTAKAFLNQTTEENYYTPEDVYS